MTMTDAPGGAAVSETHIGVVFFLGDRAYKLKKPVDMGFLDFTTRAARERALHEEARLNSRFAPDVYLGVADVRGPDGAVCDHLLVMRRMPADRRLSRLVDAGEPVDEALRSTARTLAAWHARAPRGAEISHEGGRDALRGRWEENIEQARPFHGRPLDTAHATEIETRALDYLEGRDPLFRSRVEEGRVVDGHGDLLADDIFCLDDGPRALDCLEFDDRLRYLDGLDDAACLAMDLERLGAPGLAERFTGWYAEFAADAAPPSLRHHYVAYRAFVRAKVACLRHGQGDEGAAADAGMLAEVALRHLRAGTVGLIMVGGLPGTGKSTLAGAVADRLGCTLLSSDRVRKELAGISPDEPAAGPYGTGIYSPEWNHRVYAELAHRAERLLGLGETVVLDASWTSRDNRELTEEIARRTHAETHALQCEAPHDVIAGRIRERPRTPSDADAEIAQAMASTADPWPQATTIDTSGPLEKSLDQALAKVRPHGADHVWHRRPRIAPD
jgi:aminoglycoside phosphotransferase family enzyme/predicted kinase